ncbi:Uncharacterised protein [Mycobacteroides abscessus]|nr:Uncharacterised protein [Mycobacteroides abscessus]
MPWLRTSPTFHPTPTPSTARPPERVDTVAQALAVCSTSRWGSNATPEPTISRSVADAAYASTTGKSRINGSRARNSASIASGVSTGK